MRGASDGGSSVETLADVSRWTGVNTLSRLTPEFSPKPSPGASEPGNVMYRERPSSIGELAGVIGIYGRVKLTDDVIGLAGVGAVGMFISTLDRSFKSSS
jgi:hypothetical protein